MLTEASTQTEALPAELSLPEAFRYAQRLQQNDQLEAAETLYQRLLEVLPDQPDLLHGLGLLHFQRGQIGLALDCLARAIEAAPDHPDFHANLGNIELSEGLTERAFGSYQRALALEPGRADFHSNLGVLLRLLGQQEAAEVAYERAIALDPAHYRAYNNLGMLAAARGDIEAAVRHYCTSITLMPLHPDGHKLLGMAYHSLGRLDEAAEVYRQWLAQDPGNPTARHQLAACSGRDVPPRAADDYVEQTFDRFASSFEDQLQNRLSYRAPELVAAALARHLPEPALALSVLDLGCGTGLCGPLLKPWAGRLTGVDLSVGMLARAEAKACYDQLYKIELTEFLQKPEQAGTWNLILSADTLCYFGPLEQVAGAARQALVPGGLLAFSVEDAAAQPAPQGYRLNPHGRYAHQAGYLGRCLDTAGFDLLGLDAVTLRTEGGLPVAGWVVVARAAC